MPNTLAPSCCWRGGSPQVCWATMAIRVLRPTPEGFLIAYRPRCCREEEKMNLQVLVSLTGVAPSWFLDTAARLFPAIGTAWGEAERMMVDFGDAGMDVGARQLHCRLLLAAAHQLGTQRLAAQQAAVLTAMDEAVVALHARVTSYTDTTVRDMLKRHNVLSPASLKGPADGTQAIGGLIPDGERTRIEIWPLGTVWGPAIWWVPARKQHGPVTYSINLQYGNAGVRGIGYPQARQFLTQLPCSFKQARIEISRAEDSYTEIFDGTVPKAIAFLKSRDGRKACHIKE
jgi:hypothetical protein